MAVATPRGLAALILALERAKPRSLAALVNQFQGHDDYTEFMALVKRWLPEHYDEIEGMLEPAEQIAAFYRGYDRKWFELPEMYTDQIGFFDEELDYTVILRGCPLNLLGWQNDDIHELTFGPKALSALCALFDVEESLHGEGGGLRTAWFEQLASDGTLDQELLEQIPVYSREHLHFYLDGTEFEPVVMWMDWLCYASGQPFLDANPEWVDPYADWDETEEMAQDWRRAMEYRDRVYNFAHKMDEDIPGRVREILAFLARREQEMGRLHHESDEDGSGSRPRTLMEVYGGENQDE